MRPAELCSFWRTEHAALTQRAIIGCVQSCPPAPRFNDVSTLHWTQKYRARAATHWVPHGWRRAVVLEGIEGPQKYFPNIGSKPRYAGHVPGLRDTAGMTYGVASSFVLNVLEGDFD